MNRRTFIASALAMLVPGRPKARGGPVPEARPYIVGERGTCFGGFVLPPEFAEALKNAPPMIVGKPITLTWRAR